MSLRDDLRWLLDGADMLLAGGLPTWPKTWTTKEGARLRDLVVALHTKMIAEWKQRWYAEYRLKLALAAEDGAREANRIMTDELERLRTKGTP